MATAAGALALVFVGGTGVAEAATSEPVRYWKFWSGNVCMAIGDATIGASYAAARWNQVTGGWPEIYTANNCVTSGFPPSRRFTIKTFENDLSGDCIRITDVNGGEMFPGGADGTQQSDGWVTYNNNPIAWVNRGCTRAHYVSAVIGMMLGLRVTDSTGYNSRVMNMTIYSIENYPYADPRSGELIHQVYLGNIR